MRYLIVWTVDGTYVAGTTETGLVRTDPNPDNGLGFATYDLAVRWMRDHGLRVSARGSAYVVLGPRVVALGA